MIFRDKQDFIQQKLGDIEYGVWTFFFISDKDRRWTRLRQIVKRKMPAYRVVNWNGFPCCLKEQSINDDLFKMVVLLKKRA